jgi:hypothetical protein
MKKGHMDREGIDFGNKSCANSLLVDYINQTLEVINPKSYWKNPSS